MLKHLVLFTMLLFSGAAQSTYAQTDQTKHPSKQCEATTKKGTRCKNRTTNGSSYCHVHKDKTGSDTAPSSATQATGAHLTSQYSTDAPPPAQCKAMTREKKQCKRSARIDGYCTQHYNMHVAGTL